MPRKNRNKKRQRVKRKQKKRKNDRSEVDWWRKGPKPEVEAEKVAEASSPHDLTGCFLNDLAELLNMPQRIRSTLPPTYPNYIASIIRSYVPIIRKSCVKDLNTILGYSWPFLSMTVCPTTSMVYTAGMNIPPICMTANYTEPKWLCGKTWQKNGIYELSGQFNTGVVKCMQKNRFDLLLYTINCARATEISAGGALYRGIYACKHEGLAEKLQFKGKFRMGDVLVERPEFTRSTLHVGHELDLNDCIKYNPLVRINYENDHLFVITSSTVLHKTTFNQYSLKCELANSENFFQDFLLKQLDISPEHVSDWIFSENPEKNIEPEPCELVCCVELPYEILFFRLIDETDFIICLSSNHITLVRQSTLEIVKTIQLSVNLSSIQNIQYSRSENRCLLLHSLERILQIPTEDFIDGILKDNLRHVLETKSYVLYKGNYVMDLPLVGFDSRRQQIILETDSRIFTWLDIY